MVTEFNNELALKGCPFRYEYDEYGTSGNSQIKITLPSMNSVDSFTINPTRDFFDWMGLWFKNKGIELSCNADGSLSFFGIERRNYNGMVSKNRVK